MGETWQSRVVFDREQLQRAVGLSTMGHAFMKWLGDLDRDAGLAFDRMHVRMTVPDATREWVERNYLTIPVRCRPTPEDLASFGNLVGTYLETSFELVPGRARLESNCGCLCSLCASFVSLSSLKTKQLGRNDKEGAQELVRAYVRDRAAELGCSVTDAVLETIVGDPELREALAMATWGRELLRRLDGVTKGPAVLVLWRTFAWKPTGSPKPGFEISARAIIEADARCADTIVRVAM